VTPEPEGPLAAHPFLPSRSVLPFSAFQGPFRGGARRSSRSCPEAPLRVSQRPLRGPCRGFRFGRACHFARRVGARAAEPSEVIP